ncbi:hypothetical protein RND81_04G075500 [Saponaria officinalis]|uniref:Uncharacterized protein n=1 Tax=Saponaria officinalis TaxID=3572 RepID=A0AAW1LIG2_SAPOF
MDSHEFLCDSQQVKRGTIDLYAAQCSTCQKWRTIATKEEYEEVRSKFVEEPFTCNMKPDVSCDDPPDLDYDATRTWVIDKPNLPVTPEGFKRELILRPDYSKLDAHYVTPDGKKVRCHAEVAQYLQKHPELNHLKVEDFNFTVPKIMEDTIPEDARKKRLEKSANKKQKLDSASPDGKKKPAKS